MEGKEYQNLAMRTNDGKGTNRLLDWTNVDANGKSILTVAVGRDFME